MMCYQEVLKDVGGKQSRLTEGVLSFTSATHISQRTDNKTILQNRSKFIMVHTSTGHKQALQEVMNDQAIKTKLADTKAAQEVQALDQFYEMMNMDPDRAFYGFKDVSKAAERGAIGTLLVTDELFRAAEVVKRRQYIALVESARASGGKVFVFSSLHVSGESKISLCIPFFFFCLMDGCSVLLTSSYPSL